MRKQLTALLLAAFSASPLAWAQPTDGEEAYPRHADAYRKDDVKYGEWINKNFENSEIFPGTVRGVNVYVPAEYDGKTPACVMVIQDGGGFDADVVVSNLLAKKEIPVMIVVGVGWGLVPSLRDQEAPRQNRTYEYDTPSPRYGDFILEEILPFVETLKTSDGREIKLSKDGNDRMIAGYSSGAAAAFNAAWSHPEDFSKVVSGIGSFTGLRGSFENSTMIHKVETKPLRIFLQSGAQDMWTAFGDWWAANTAMVRALQFAGYDYQYALGTGGHSGWQANSVFPDIMRYMWKDWPQKIKPLRKSNNHFLNSLIIDGSDYVEVCEFSPEGVLVSDGMGGVVASDVNGAVKISPDGSKSPLAQNTVLAVSINSDLLEQNPEGGLTLASAGGKKIFSTKEKIFAASAAPLKNGGFYVAGAKKRGRDASFVWYLSPEGKLEQIDENIKGARLAVCPNEDWLYVFEYDTRRGFSYRIEEDYSTKYKQEFFYLHVPDEYDTAQSNSIICDESGITFVATSAGIQACDWNGRSTAIFPLPNGAVPVSIAFGGENLDTIYILANNGKIYKRTFNVKGSSVFHVMPKIRVGAG